MSWLTIITPATTFDLTVLATVKQELGITVTTYDDQLTRLIHEASIACATYCDCVFALEEVSETFWLNCAMDELRLARRPVTTITSVVESGVTLTAGTDYAFDPATGSLFRLDGNDNRSAWTGKVVVQYSGGYALLDGVPRDIERACIALIKTLWFSLTRDPLVRSVEVPGVMTETFWVGGIGDNGALPPNVTALLDPYRRLGV